MIGSLDLAQIMDLKIVVEVGLVTGVTPGYNTYRFRNLHIAFHVVFINNAYRLGIFDIMPNVFTGKQCS